MKSNLNEKKPGFIVLGGHRCGTTYLYENLIEHPDIYLNSKKKELHFFDRDENFKKGLEYYNKFFLNAQNKVIGDITPNYFSQKNVPKRIFNTIKDVKLVVILRNPVTRSFSHYRLFQSNIKKYQNLSFRETIDLQYDKIIRESMYSVHLTEFLKYFSEDQIHVIIFEEMMRKKEKAFKDLFRFLGVDFNFIPPFIEKKINSGNSRKYNSNYYLLYLFQRMLKKIKLKKFSHLIDTFNTKTLDPISKADKSMLEKIFKNDKNKLELILNKKLDDWNF